VAYERHGHGEPVVLLHGLGYHRKSWDAIVPLLSTHREIITIDLPGFGQSPDPDPRIPRNPETATAWLDAIFKALKIEQPHVAGHSLGGLLALRAGQSGIAKTVTALAPAGFWTRAERRRTYALLHAAHYGVRLLPDTALEAVLATPPARAVLTGTLYGRPEKCPPHIAAATLRTLQHTPAIKASLQAGRAPHLFTGNIPDIPVTIAWGTHDRLLPPHQATRAHTMIPHAHLVPLPGCGHIPMLDAAELVAHTILHATQPHTPHPPQNNPTNPQTHTHHT
jgi:pimeloyl-ACP methyl ester carboxylesterase